MCGRNIRGGRVRENIAITEIRIGDFKTWFPKPFLRQLKTLSMCGNFGDPIIAADCIDMLSYARSANGALHFNLNTNGSARDSQFWCQLADLGVTVHFAIDGATSQSHVRYRRHTRFDAILQNAKTFIDAGGTAVWDMLVFRHNQGEVEAAEALSVQMGFAEFHLKSTNRFYGSSHSVEDERGNAVDTLHPSDSFPAPLLGNRPSHSDLETCEIACKVLVDKSVYVDASGQVFPCCWLGAQYVDKPNVPDSRHSNPQMTAELENYQELISMIGAQNLNLRNQPLPVIVNRYFPHFARRWSPGVGRLTKCARICGQTGMDPIESTFVRGRQADSR